MTVIDIVRREEQAQILREAGAQHVVSSSSDSFQEDLKFLCRNYGAQIAFDAVASELTGQLAEALEPDGEILVYGQLSGEPSRFDPATVTFKNLSVRGFWLTRWSAEQSFIRQLWLTRQIMGALNGGFATTEVARAVGLQEGLDAAALHVASVGKGKVLIVPDSDLGSE